jgi:hypothetical protein
MSVLVVVYLCTVERLYYLHFHDIRSEGSSIADGDRLQYTFGARDFIASCFLNGLADGQCNGFERGFRTEGRWSALKL